MKLHVKTQGCGLGTKDERLLMRKIDRFEERLHDYDADLVHLEVVIEKQARRKEYTAQIRLIIGEHVLPAQRNRAPGIGTLIRLAFADLGEELERFNAQIRGEGEWRRKRGMHSDTHLREVERELTELRASLDEALAPGRAEFEVLAESRLPGVRKVIFEQLTANGRNPTAEQLDKRAARDARRRAARHRRQAGRLVPLRLARVDREARDQGTRACLTRPAQLTR